jgi:hypothetical protein
MDDYSKYPWHRLYLAAVLETDQTLIAWRIVTALDAIDQRAVYVEPDGEEFRAIEQTKLKLDAMKKEREAGGLMVLLVWAANL